MFFASLIAAVIHLRIHNSLFGGGSGVGATLAVINTVILFTSGVTAHFAQTSYRARRKGWFFFLLVLTIVLGIAFLCGQAWEYTHTGFGLSPSIIALVVLTADGVPRVPRGLRHPRAHLPVLPFAPRAEEGARRAATAGRPRRARPGMVDGATYYWHFVDAVWVFVFIVRYLL